jgi:hypothetical protein
MVTRRQQPRYVQVPERTNRFSKEVRELSLFAAADGIATYRLDQAIEEEVLVEIFKNRWEELSGGKPIVATAHRFNEISLAGLLEIWHAFLDWHKPRLTRHKQIRPTLPEAERLFQTPR